jgi:DNA mismatch endonuclease (patch repair protein)
MKPRERHFAVLTKSEQMSRVRTAGTEPELLLRKALWRTGIRYRLNTPLTGRPDLVIPGAMIAIFVDGCFWHGCPEHYTAPATNNTFWAKKLERNATRDSLASQALKDQGWTVLRFWEHEIYAELDAVVACVRSSLTQTSRKS